MRKVHFFSLLIPIWARERANVTWITDQDEFVANDVRHDDALQAAGLMSSLYYSAGLGILRLNTVDQEMEKSEFEDICAIPDLAAGAIADISARLSKNGGWEKNFRFVLDDPLPNKTALIADWFWDEDMPLRKTMITIDLHGDKYGVRKVWMN